MSRTATPAPAPVASKRVVGVCAGLVLAAGLLISGAGLVVAIALKVTVLRGNRAASRFLLGLGLALLVLAVGVHAAWWSRPSLHIGPATPA